MVRGTGLFTGSVRLKGYHLDLPESDISCLILLYLSLSLSPQYIMIITTRKTPVFNSRISSMLTFLRTQSEGGKHILKHKDYLDFETPIITHLHLIGAIKDTKKGIIVEKL